MQRVIYALSILLLGLLSAAASAQDSDLNAGIIEIQHAWEHVHYQLPKDEQAAAFLKVEIMADTLITRYPGRAEPLKIGSGVSAVFARTGSLSIAWCQ